MSALRILAALTLLLAPATAFAQPSASAYTSGTRYDADGRVTGTIAPDPDGTGPLHYAAVRNSYDAGGRLIKVETGELAAWQSDTVAPTSWTGFTIFRSVDTTYDVLGHKTLETVREGAAGTVRSATQYGYDSFGRLECTAVRMNPAIFGSLPTSACTLGTAGGDGPDRITRNVYDAAGQRLQLREGVGTGDEGTEATWAYNANGQVTTVIDGNGNRADLHYDGHGRQDRWTFPSTTRPSSFNDATPAAALASAGSVNAADYEEYGYDLGGNRTSLRKRDGSTLSYSYDALNRVTVKTVPERLTGSQTLTTAQTRDVYYSYDLRNLQLSARFDSQAGEGVINAHDGFGRLASSTTTMGGVTRTLSYQYDANGNRTRIVHPEGTWFDTLYDGLNRQGVTGVIGSLTLNGFAYDAQGNQYIRTYLGNAAGTTTYSFDGIGRLSWMVHDNIAGTASDVLFSFSYNPASQIVGEARSNDLYAWTGHYAVNRGYTTNGLNQYSAAGAGTFAYDANGNLTSDASNAYVYDVENRLVSASGAHNATLAYDPLGRLWQLTGGSGTTQFLYDGDRLVAEYEGAGALLRRYFHSNHPDDPLVWYEGSVRRHFLADRQGSIVGLIDDSGNLVAANTYDEYGIPGAANQGRFQYTGQAWLPELGMYYYKARIYSPTLGRFMQTDPIGYADQFNLYAYVGDDPVNGTDPSGLAECTGSHIGCGGGGLAPSFSGSSTGGTEDTEAAEGSSPGRGPRTFYSGQPGSGGGGPHPPADFLPPTNPPSQPPTTGPTTPNPRGGGWTAPGPNGTEIRGQPPTRTYPNGYWRMSRNGQYLDPSTGRQPAGRNLTRAEFNARTHVAFPRDPPHPVDPLSSVPRSLAWPAILLYFIGIWSPPLY